MRRVVVIAALCVAVAAVIGAAAQVRTGTLSIYFVDTEGGQSTLFVGPSGESLLVDTGNPGERDLGRIAETLRTAGVTRIDHLWTTHYHGDHVGALLELARSEEHTSELQSQSNLVCRLLLEKKKFKITCLQP